MAEVEQSGKAAQTRHITVSSKWLQDSGFKIGDIVDITCEDSKLTITLSKEQRYAYP